MAQLDAGMVGGCAVPCAVTPGPLAPARCACEGTGLAAAVAGAPAAFAIRAADAFGNARRGSDAFVVSVACQDDGGAAPVAARVEDLGRGVYQARAGAPAHTQQHPLAGTRTGAGCPAHGGRCPAHLPGAAGPPACRGPSILQRAPGWHAGHSVRGLGAGSSPRHAGGICMLPQLSRRCMRAPLPGGLAHGAARRGGGRRPARAPWRLARSSPACAPRARAGDVHRDSRGRALGVRHGGRAPGRRQPIRRASGAGTGRRAGLPPIWAGAVRRRARARHAPLPRARRRVRQCGRAARAA